MKTSRIPAATAELEVFMRPLAHTLLTVILCIAPAAIAAAGPHDGPEYNGVFEERDPATGAYTPLELAVPTTLVKPHLGFIAGATGYIAFRGAHSPVRFRAGDKIEFVVREASHYGDPSLVLQFFVLRSDGDKRLLLVDSYGGAFGINSSTKSADDYAVPFTVAQFGDHLIKVTLLQPLPPGEYSLGATGTSDGFCFGIDP